MATHHLKKAIPIEEKVRVLYDKFGQRKPMGLAVSDVRKPLYFLHRTFLAEQDLLIIFNTKRCRYQCHFCQLPLKSSRYWISGEDILAQFEYVINEMKNSLSVLDKLTLANEGSVLDVDTFPTKALLTIARCVHELRLVRRLVLETRLEFVNPSVIKKIQKEAPKAIIDILTGFETRDPYIRDNVLCKDEHLDIFLSGLDKVAQSGAELTSYILFKPAQTMTDKEAFVEAETSITYLANQCRTRNIPLTIRLNPMYAAAGSRWAKIANETSDYQPPQLTDVMKLAAKKKLEGLKVYIGLSSEDLDEPWGSYIAREDYSRSLIKPIKLFNDGKISSFDGII